MLVRILFAILNGIVTWVVLTLIVVLLGMLGVGQLATFDRFIYAISIIIAFLTFLGAIPSYWNRIIK